MKNKKIFYSKSLNDILNLKEDFLINNKSLIAQSKKWNKYYSNQPKRKFCKACEKKIKSKLFKSHFANYTICDFCGHLNGLNQDTKKFNKFLYKEDKKKLFSNFYKKDYNLRVKNISLPKLNFLNKVIKGKKEILELGSGAGHFLKACELKSIKATGYDVNSTMVNLGKKMLKKNKINHFEIDDIYDKVLNCDQETIAILGVIEHLEFPNLIFENFQKSKAKYLFFAVPLMSLTVLLEHCFQKTYPRVLGGVHNHLYSEKSLNYIFKKYKLKVLAEWWFGSDMSDLMRVLKVYSNSYNKEKYFKIFNKYFLNVIDNLQSVLDKNKICGDVHMVISKK